jgi:endonuclease IV
MEHATRLHTSSRRNYYRVCMSASKHSLNTMQLYTHTTLAAHQTALIQKYNTMNNDNNNTASLIAPHNSRLVNISSPHSRRTQPGYDFLVFTSTVPWDG